MIITLKVQLFSYSGWALYLQLNDKYKRSIKQNKFSFVHMETPQTLYFIPQGLVLRSIVYSWILKHRIWRILWSALDAMHQNHLGRERLKLVIRELIYSTIDLSTKVVLVDGILAICCVSLHDELALKRICSLHGVNEGQQTRVVLDPRVTQHHPPKPPWQTSNTCTLREAL
mgnify:CR=1 FL=1